MLKIIKTAEYPDFAPIVPMDSYILPPEKRRSAKADLCEAQATV